MSLEQTIDNLQIRNANMVTFVGTSNTMVDTTTGRIQTKGIQHNSNVITDVSGPHGRIGPTLKKYPEFIFEEGKFEANDSTKTYVRAGYTVSSSSTFVSGTDARVAWRAFDGNADGTGNPPNIWQTHYANTFDTNSPYGIHTNNTTKGTFTADGVTYIGEWIKLKLPHKIKLNYLKWETSIDTRRPKKGAILGSNNNSDWYTVKAFNNDLVWTVDNVADYAHITSSSNSAYTYFMVVIEQVQGGDGSCWGNQISLYGYEDLATQGDHSVDTTFKSRFNNPQTTGVQVLVDGATGVGTNQISGGPDPSGNQSTYVTDGKYWTLNGTLTSNLSVEANTFLEGDQPHAVSVWFNSSNLEANVSNTCVFSIASEEKLDSVNLDLQSNTWHNLTYSYQGEGGSRVTYLDGRKVAEDQAEDTFGDYPPFAMTGYSQGGYVASASSEYTTYSAWNGFDEIQSASGIQNHWSGSSQKYNTSDGDWSGDTASIYTTNVEGVNKYGEWLQIEFPHKIKYNYSKIKAPYNYSERQPRDGYIVGSNDLSGQWTTLHRFTGVTRSSGTETVTYTPPSAPTNAFKYIRLVIEAMTASTGQYAGIDEWDIYGHRENDLVRLPDPTHVLKYPHLNFTNHGTASTNGYHATALRGYVVSASTKYSSGSNTDAWRAFDGVVDLTSGSGGQSWDSATNTYASSGTGRASTGTTTFNSRNGEWINIKFPHKVLLTSYQHWTRMDRDHEGPYSGYLYGSNDGFSTFQEIHRFAAITLPTTSGGVKYLHTVSSSYTPSGGSAVTLIPYNEYRLQVTHTQGSPYLNIALLEFYGTGVDSIPIQIGGGNIDKVANFRVYDKFIEEDQVNEIWNAQKEEFGRAKPQMVLQQGKLGIGTAAPQGSLSVADEPNEVEEFPPRAMTAEETHFEGHGTFKVALSSADNGNNKWTAFNKRGFTGVDDNDYLEWGSTQYTAATGVYTGSVSTQGVSGEWLEIEMPYKIKLEYNLLYHRTRDGTITNDYWVLERMPRDGAILGSNDGETWTTLQSWTDFDWVTGTSATGQRQSEYWRTPGKFVTNSTAYYKTFRLVFSKLFGANGDRPNISEWRLFGTREQGQSVLHDGQLTLTKSLNVPRIGPALDADDTPRRDKLIVEYNTSTNPTFEGAVRDTSGRGNDGVFYNGASYDATDKALVFDGTSNDQFVHTLKNGRSESGNIDYSVSLWFNPTTVNVSRWRAVFAIGVLDRTQPTDNDGDEVTLFVRNGSDVLHLQNGGSSVDTTDTVKPGQWVHIVVTYDGTNRKIYLDGSLSVSNGYSSINFPKEMLIRLAQSIPNNGEQDEYMDCKISNFKAWFGAALTAEEVKTLYDMGRCDEGHRTMNFSKTRVGIGLGDGEVPKGVLDVRGDLYVNNNFVPGRYVGFSLYAKTSVSAGVVTVWDGVYCKSQEFAGLPNTTGFYRIPYTGKYLFTFYGLFGATSNMTLYKNSSASTTGGSNTKHIPYHDKGSGEGTWMQLVGSGVDDFAAGQFVYMICTGALYGQASSPHNGFSLTFLGA